MPEERKWIFVFKPIPTKVMSRFHERQNPISSDSSPFITGRILCILNLKWLARPSFSHRRWIAPRFVPQKEFNWYGLLSQRTKFFVVNFKKNIRFPVRVVLSARGKPPINPLIVASNHFSCINPINANGLTAARFWFRTNAAQNTAFVLESHEHNLCTYWNWYRRYSNSENLNYLAKR